MWLKMTNDKKKGHEWESQWKRLCQSKQESERKRKKHPQMITHDLLSIIRKEIHLINEESHSKQSSIIKLVEISNKKNKKYNWLFSYDHNDSGTERQQIQVVFVLHIECVLFTFRIELLLLLLLLYERR